jgi:predicted RNase H-like nuclease
MSAKLQARVFEVHPEVSFALMNGGAPIVSKKAHAEGHARRKQVLAAAGFPVGSLPQGKYLRKDLAPDDILDACACAWSARRILDGRSQRFPADPPIDQRGLRMEINA